MVDAVLGWLHGPAFDLQLRQLFIKINDWIRCGHLLQASAIHVRDLRIDWDNLLQYGIGEFG